MNKSYSLLSNFISLWGIMTLNEKRKSLLFIFFTFVQVSLETLSIGSLYPLLLGIFNKDMNIFNNNLFSLDYFKNFAVSENQILLISIIILSMFLIKNLFLVFLVHWTQTFERNVKVRLKQHLLKSYLNNDYLFHVNADTAKLVRNISTSTSTIMGSMRMSMTFINDFLLFFFLLLFMLTINTVLVLYSATAISILSFLYFLFFKKMLIKYGQFSFEHEGESLKRLLQSFSLIKEIKLFRKENYFLNFFHSEEKSYQEFQRKAFIIRSYPRIFFELIFVFGILTFININILSHQESFSEILPKTALLAIIIIRMIPSLNKIIFSAQKINQLQKSNDEVIKELRENVNLEETLEKNTLSNFYGFKKITLENIDFKYPSKNNYIFKNFNLEIKNGDYLGIVGSSGCGKSTLVDIITGLLKPSAGHIKINNEIAKLDSKEWKDIFGYVPQVVNLFNDTIFTNITFETDIDKINLTKLDKAIEMAGLSSFVKRLSKGIHTNVGELGYKISGGEKQRMSIARALYKESQILIFDESFNSLDKIMKDSILSEIKHISKYKTVVIISHIIEDLKDCKNLVYLEKK